MHFKLFHFFECLALLVALISLKKLGRSGLVIFIPFLVIVLLYEIGTPAGWFLINNSNHLAANLFMIVQFSFYLLLFLFVFGNKSIRRGIYASETTLIFFFLVNFFFNQGMGVYNSLTYIFGSLVIIGWCCYLFYYLMARTEGLKLIQYPYFWIYSGVLVFYLFRFIFMSYFTFLAYQANDLYIQLFKSITTISIILLYSCISIGLVCFKPPLRKI